MRRRTRQSASTVGGGTPDMSSGRADPDQAGARPPSSVTRERVPDLRRICRAGGAERIPTCAGRQTGWLLSFFPLHTNDLN
jgi:hypothetical protein